MASWSYVGIGGGTSPTSGNVTPTEPTGAAQGDLLVCVISYRGSAAFTAPAGWTIVQQESSGNTDVDVSTSIASGLIAYIVRGASAPSYTFTRTGGDIAIARVVAYTPVGGTITFDESNSATLGSAGTTVSMTGLTTNAANSLIVVGACGASNSAASAFDAATDPTTGSGAGNTTTTGTITAGTWRRRNSTGSTNGADTNISIADAVRATAGATGDIQYTAASSRRHAIVGAAFTITPATYAGAGAAAAAGTAVGAAGRAINADAAAAASGTAVGAARKSLSTAAAAAASGTAVGAAGRRAPGAAGAAGSGAAVGAASRRGPASAVAAVVSVANGQVGRRAIAAGAVSGAASVTAAVGSFGSSTAAASASGVAAGSLGRAAPGAAAASGAGAVVGAVNRTASISAAPTGAAVVLAFVNRTASASASAQGRADAAGEASILGAEPANGNLIIERRRRRM